MTLEPRNRLSQAVVSLPFIVYHHTDTFDLDGLGDAHTQHSTSYSIEYAMAFRKMQPWVVKSLSI
jgi:hypothetical protein